MSFISWYYEVCRTSMILFGIDSESKGNDISMGHWSVYLYLNKTNHFGGCIQYLLTVYQQNRRIISLVPIIRLLWIKRREMTLCYRFKYVWPPKYDFFGFSPGTLLYSVKPKVLHLAKASLGSVNPVLSSCKLFNGTMERSITDALLNGFSSY